MFYIYAYINPITNTPFYIGKGSGSRLYHHLNEASSKKENKEKWQIINDLKTAGYSPLIVVLEDGIDNELMAFNREDFFILKYGRKGIDTNGILTNKTIGGKQPPRPVWDNAKKKAHSEWNKSYWTDARKQEHREKFLKPITDDIRKKISKHSIGSVAVTDQFGNSKRISKEEFAAIDKSGEIQTWKYVSVSSKESKRRKQTISP